MSVSQFAAEYVAESIEAAAESWAVGIDNLPHECPYDEMARAAIAAIRHHLLERAESSVVNMRQAPSAETADAMAGYADELKRFTVLFLTAAFKEIEEA